LARIEDSHCPPLIDLPNPGATFAGVADHAGHGPALQLARIEDSL